MEDLLKMTCPYCQENVFPSLSGISYSYPSHGGDYDWIETGGNATCPNCKKISSVRLQIDIDTDKVWEIVTVYPPNK